MELYRKQWHYITSPKKKARTIPFISYITVFLDTKGSILVDFLPIRYRQSKKSDVHFTSTQ